MLTVNTTRQPFDSIAQPKRIDLKSYKIRGQARFPPIINLLIIGSSLGLFIYINTYFIQKISNVISGSVYSTPTPMSPSCDFYFCDESAYNFINYYSNYQQCNTRNCQNLVCTGYSCTDYGGYDINYFYACQGKCQSGQLPIPGIVWASFIVSCCAVGVFGLGIVIGIGYGLVAGLGGRNLSNIERAGLVLTWLWPKLKYYGFRRRQEWDNFYFDLRGMVIVDMIINACYAITLALYIYLESNEFWQTGPQIACFYMLIWATVSRATMVGQIAGPFFEANRELSMMRLEMYS